MDDDFDVAVEGREEMHEALDGEAVETVIRERGKVRLIDFQAPRGDHLRKTLPCDELIGGHREAHATLSSGGGFCPSFPNLKLQFEPLILGFFPNSA